LFYIILRSITLFDLPLTRNDEIFSKRVLGDLSRYQNQPRLATIQLGNPNERSDDTL